jgi:hypothetical protein
MEIEEKTVSNLLRVSSASDAIFTMAVPAASTGAVTRKDIVLPKLVADLLSVESPSLRQLQPTKICCSSA